MFNNYKQRKEYLKDFVNVYSFTEETFLVHISKNKFAMNFIRTKNKNYEDKYGELDSNFDFDYDLCMLIYAIGDMNILVDIITFIAFVEDNELYEDFHSLIKKAFSKLYKEFVNYNEKNIYDYLLFKKYDLNDVLFLYAFFNKEIKNERLKKLLTAQASLTYDNYVGLKLGEKLSNELFTKYKWLIDWYDLDKKDLTLNDINLKNLDLLRSTALENIHNELDDNEIQGTVNLALKRSDEFFYQYIYKDKDIIVNSNKIQNFLNTISFFSLYGKDIFYNSKITKDDLATVFSIMDNYSDLFKLSKSEIEKYFLIALYIHMLSKKLKNNVIISTNNFIKSYSSEYDLKEFRKEKNAFDRLHSDEINSLNTKIINLDKTINHLELENNNLKANIKRMSKKKKKDKDNNEELYALRELFFSMEHDDYIDKNIDIDSLDYSIVNDKKIAFIGATDSLHNKLKEYFPNISYVNADMVTKDLNYIKNMDYVFLHIHMKHKLYYKAIETIRPAKVPFSFLDNKSVDILAKEMIDRIKNLD